jgi:hypothetical protein
MRNQHGLPSLRATALLPATAALAGFSQVYYVATNGSDSADGSFAAAPCRCSAGDTPWASCRPRF